MYYMVEMRISISKVQGRQCSKRKLSSSIKLSHKCLILLLI